jgi:hypothetical protein
VNQTGQGELACAGLAHQQHRHGGFRRQADLGEQAAHGRQRALPGIVQAPAQGALAQIDEALRQEHRAGRLRVGQGPSPAEDEEAALLPLLRQRQELHLPPALPGGKSGQQPAHAAGRPLTCFRRRRQSVGDYLLAAVVRGGRRGTTAFQLSGGGGGEAGESFPGPVDEQQTAAAIEEEEGVAGLLEEGLPAEVARQGARTPRRRPVAGSLTHGGALTGG